MLYRISVTERGLTGIANIFRSRLSRLDDLLGAGTVPLRQTAKAALRKLIPIAVILTEFNLTSQHVLTGTSAVSARDDRDIVLCTPCLLNVNSLHA